MAFERIEPFGSLWDDFKVATVVSTLVNINLRKDAKPISARDVFNTLRADEQEPDFDNLTEQERTAALDAAFFGVLPNG